MSRRTVHALIPFFLALATGFASLPVFAADPPPAPATLESLQTRIAEIVQQPRYHAALWGVKIVSLDTGKTAFEFNSDKLFSPASNAKLFTGALALDRLGPEFRSRTSLYAKARPDAEGTLAGDLVVYGRGDPTINARLHGGDIFQALAPLVAALTNAGVKRIQGDLVGDDSYFRGPPFGSSWSLDDFQSAFGAELSALSINDNILRLTLKPGGETGSPVRLSLAPAAAAGFLAISNHALTTAQGSARTIHVYRPLGENVLHVTGSLPLDGTAAVEEVTVHQPAALFAALFREALARQGILVSGRVRAVDWLGRIAEPIDFTQWTELGAVESAPLRVVLMEALKASQNLYADVLLEQAGVLTQTNSASAMAAPAETAGLKALAGFLSGVGIRPDEALFNEGSGLSRNDLTTPNAIVTLLQFMGRHRSAAVYQAALPIAGVDGTLRDRMNGTVAAGKVRAKTGSLTWASALSGYVTTAAGEHLAFSLLLNRYHDSDSAHEKTGDLDAIAVLLAGFTGRTSHN